MSDGNPKEHVRTVSMPRTEGAEGAIARGRRPDFRVTRNKNDRPKPVRVAKVGRMVARAGPEPSSESVEVAQVFERTCSKGRASSVTQLA